jgi:hypothetical protein
LEAIEILFQQSLPPGAQIDALTARRYIAKTIHLVVYAKKTARMVNDQSALINRRVEKICLVKGVNQHGLYQLEEI